MISTTPEAYRARGRRDNRAVAHRDGMPSPKSTAETRDAFRALVPDDERVSVRPMFGSVAAFVNGQMFMCLFADEMYFKLAEADRAALAKIGGGPLEPMPGRPMKEYADLPDWQARPDDVREWAGKSLDYVAALPPKKK
jgi:TfoX/Sxy family transcriptional regulator of competence genes